MGRMIGLRLQPGEGLAGRLAETRQPYQSNDISRGRRPRKERILNQMEAAGGCAAAGPGPVYRFPVDRPHPQEESANPVPFTPDEMQLLGSVADMAANALQRASLHEQTLRHAEELLAINSMGRILAETLDLDQIYAETG